MLGYHGTIQHLKPLKSFFSFKLLEILGFHWKTYGLLKRLLYSRRSNLQVHMPSKLHFIWHSCVGFILLNGRFYTLWAYIACQEPEEDEEGDSMPNMCTSTTPLDPSLLTLSDVPPAKVRDMGGKGRRVCFHVVFGVSLSVLIGLIPFPGVGDSSLGLGEGAQQAEGTSKAFAQRTLLPPYCA